VSRKADPVVGR